VKLDDCRSEKIDAPLAVYYKATSASSATSFALARSIEYFPHPAQWLTIGVGKSTYARLRNIVNVTPFEPIGKARTLESATPLRSRQN